MVGGNKVTKYIIIYIAISAAKYTYEKKDSGANEPEYEATVTKQSQ